MASNLTGSTIASTYDQLLHVDTLPKNFGGMAHGPVIRILKRLKGDEGIRQHELTHIKQWFFTLGLLPILLGLKSAGRKFIDLWYISFRSLFKWLI